MKMPENIMFAKIGWSEDYTGGIILGRASWIKKSRGDAHERFNFLPGPDGSFYGYIPPIGQKFSTPQPDDTSGWLVIFVAPLAGHGPLVPVGWYVNATIESETTERPEYTAGVAFDMDVKGDPYLYTISANTARLIPAGVRHRIRVPGTPRFGSSPILYAAGHGPKKAWRKTYLNLAKKIIAEPWDPANEALSHDGGFAGVRIAKEVEAASVAAACAEFKRLGFTSIQDRQKDNCGYDFLIRKPGKKACLHVEVKGTSGKTPRFFMTPNEHDYMVDPRWRLAIVTDALGIPCVEILDARDVAKRFTLLPRVWEGRSKEPTV